MNCPQHEEASAYLDEMLTPSERQQFAVHMRICPICSQRVDELTALRQTLHDLPSPVLGFDLAARLEAQTRRGATRRRPVRSFGSFWTGWGAPGLAVSLSLASGAWLGVMLVGGGAVAAPPATMVRVFDPVPPGGLCAAVELCSISKGLK